MMLSASGVRLVVDNQTSSPVQIVGWPMVVTEGREEECRMRAWNGPGVLESTVPEISQTFGAGESGNIGAIKLPPKDTTGQARDSYGWVRTRFRLQMPFIHETYSSFSLVRYILISSLHLSPLTRFTEHIGFTVKLTLNFLPPRKFLEQPWDTSSDSTHDFPMPSGQFGRTLVEIRPLPVAQNHHHRTPSGTVVDLFKRDSRELAAPGREGGQVAEAELTYSLEKKAECVELRLVPSHRLRAPTSTRGITNIIRQAHLSSCGDEGGSDHLPKAGRDPPGIGSCHSIVPGMRYVDFLVEVLTFLAENKEEIVLVEVCFSSRYQRASLSVVRSQIKSQGFAIPTSIVRSIESLPTVLSMVPTLDQLAAALQEAQNTAKKFDSSICIGHPEDLNRDIGDLIKTNTRMIISDRSHLAEGEVGRWDRVSSYTNHRSDYGTDDAKKILDALQETKANATKRAASKVGPAATIYQLQGTPTANL
ncbi:hypothetical protein P7C70_g2314, partial [Phenoliferia sp. Uapishka_3]